MRSLKLDSFVPLSGILPTGQYFHDYLALDSDVSFFYDFENSVFFLPAEKRDSTAVIHPRTFAADVYCTSDAKLDQNTITEIFLKAEEFFLNKGLTSITYKPIPTYMMNSKFDWLPDYKSTFIETSVLSINEYSPSNRRRRNIRKSSQLRCNIISSDNYSISKTWSFLEQFLNSRGLPALTVERVKYLINTFPNLFALANAINGNGEIVAAALVNFVGRCMRIPNYCSDKKSPGSIDFLLDSLIKYAKSRGYQIVDLGTSIDPVTKREVNGIVDFKAEFSCRREKMLTFHKQLV